MPVYSGNIEMKPIISVTRSTGKLLFLSAQQNGKKLFRAIAGSFLCISLFMLPACNPEEWEVVDCSECYVDKPSEAEINIELTLDQLNPFVEINIYSGRIEEEIVILTDTARSETWSALLPADEYYTVTATYRSGSQTQNYYNVTAIDGGFVRTKKILARCDKPCWVIRGNNFNVRLKYK
jgi:hypothetical protein